MKRELIEFQDIEKDLYEISESPCFNDDMRNNAQALYQYISEYKEEPLTVGDWCRFTNNDGEFFISEITRINIPEYCAKFNKGLWERSEITKLTDEELKLLRVGV